MISRQIINLDTRFGKSSVSESKRYCHKKLFCQRSREISSWVKVLAIKPDDRSSLPGINMAGGKTLILIRFPLIPYSFLGTYTNTGDNNIKLNKNTSKEFLMSQSVILLVIFSELYYIFIGYLKI